VLLYEARVLDSQQVAWMLGDKEPTPGSRLTFSATAYCKGTTTASGVRVRTGIAAADPTLLPVGTVVNIATGNTRYDGVYTVMDTGPEVKGRELDLYIWSCHEALRFGRKRVQVTVLRLGWDPSASSPTLVARLFRGREAARTAPAPTAPQPAAPLFRLLDGATSQGSGAGGVESGAPAQPEGVVVPDSVNASLPVR
jgi:3D (Asp-Asp-Asp) domain-containing protein